MSKVKYYYDSETLSYKVIKRTKGKIFNSILLFLLCSALFAFLFVFIAGLYFKSPQEKALINEVENLTLQYNILNDRLENAYDVLENVEERDTNLYRHYFETSAIPMEQRRAGFGGINRYKKFEGFENSELIASSHKKLDILEKAIVVQSKSLDEIAKLAEKKEEMLVAIPAIQPVRNEDLKRMASGYGWRRDPFTKSRKFHYGMDFSAKKGTYVYAPGDGTVIRADSRSSGYGRHIRIDHGYGYVTLYGHLNGYNVKRGQKIKRGDVIGFVGNTGRSKGPHLHYEVHKDGKKINPLNFYYGNLSAEEFDLLLKNANTENQSLD